MDRQSLVRKILHRKEIRDYTYIILFLVISSFFAVFAIRPALTIAFSLKREADDLRRVNQVYETNILKLIEIQSSLEEIRDRQYLIDDAIPEKPQTAAVIDEIKRAAEKNNVVLSDLSITQVALKTEPDDTQLKTLGASIETSADFFGLSRFISELITQRRIKDIKKLKISEATGAATQEATLDIQFEVEGYYL